MFLDGTSYWLTATAASSARLHHDTPRALEPCPVSVGVAVFAHGITQSVRPLAERLHPSRVSAAPADRGGVPDGGRTPL
ncbi:hypothetical protein AB0B45_35210 [Nonomuraea sp. NPDC049152]|uniref:hypothetical protein n=1 Tax=Nonomuraea sp. NPDC049152 TaxID=3154350 RepID=UPI0033C42DDB